MSWTVSAIGFFQRFRCTSQHYARFQIRALHERFYAKRSFNHYQYRVLYANEKWWEVALQRSFVLDLARNPSTPKHNLKHVSFLIYINGDTVNGMGGASSGSPVRCPWPYGIASSSSAPYGFSKANPIFRSPHNKNHDSQTVCKASHAGVPGLSVGQITWYWWARREVKRNCYRPNRGGVNRCRLPTSGVVTFGPGVHTVKEIAVQ